MLQVLPSLQPTWTHMDNPTKTMHLLLPASASAGPTLFYGRKTASEHVHGSRALRLGLLNLIGTSDTVVVDHRRG